MQAKSEVLTWTKSVLTWTKVHNSFKKFVRVETADSIPFHGKNRDCMNSEIHNLLKQKGHKYTETH